MEVRCVAPDRVQIEELEGLLLEACALLDAGRGGRGSREFLLKVRDYLVGGLPCGSAG